VGAEVEKEPARVVVQELAREVEKEPAQVAV
jgi:hypothetical protein